MRENLPDITHERAMPVNSPLISLPQAADNFSLRAKSRLRRLRFDTRLRAQPLVSQVAIGVKEFVVIKIKAHSFCLLSVICWRSSSFARHSWLLTVA
uniref:hypothetical protein n=1 Tax=Gemmiger formicilis TaxID=745368 RepID=UPI00402991E1